MINENKEIQHYMYVYFKLISPSANRVYYVHAKLFY